MLLPLVALFIVVPIAELYLIIQVGQEIGVLPTLLVLVADSILGSLLMRSQGRAAWRRFNEATGAGRVPAREVFDGALIIFGGALLLTPGFLTDLLGLLLLLPPTRAVVRRLLVRHFGARMVASAATAAAGQRFQAPGARGTGDFDVEGTASEVAEPRTLP